MTREDAAVSAAAGVPERAGLNPRYSCPFGMRARNTHDFAMEEISFHLFSLPPHFAHLFFV